MDKNYFIQLTLAVYRVTELFPIDEPLRQKIRNKANEILAGLFLSNPNPAFPIKDLFKNIEIIDGYFNSAQNQNILDCRNFLALRREYAKIKEHFFQSQLNLQPPLKNYKSAEDNNICQSQSCQSPTLTTTDNTDALNQIQYEDRQKKILKILTEKGKAQPWEFKGIFPGITKRTLRRDFECLLIKGLIERIGEKNAAFYKIKG